VAQPELPGIDWESQKVQGPQDNPNRRPRGNFYDNLYVGQQWRDHINSERRRVFLRHFGVGYDTGDASARASMLADPDYHAVEDLSKKINEAYGVPGSASFDHVKNAPVYQPLSTMSSKRWGYTNDEGKAEQQGLDKLKIASRREMPANYSMYVEKPEPGEEPHYAIGLMHFGEKVGHLGWSGKTGHVYGLSVDEPHRALVPRLISKAHEVSHEEGHTGPTSSNELSAYSYRIMRKHAPDFIPEDTMVEGEDEHMYDDAVRAHQEAAQKVKTNWEFAKPHILAAIGNDGVALDDISRHDSRITSLLTSVNGGHLNTAGNHANRVRATNDMLFAKHARALPRTAQNALTNSDEPLRKLTESDFSDELYGH